MKTMLFVTRRSDKVDRRGISLLLDAFKPHTVSRGRRAGCKIPAFAFTGLALSGRKRLFGQEQGLSSRIANSLSMAIG